MDARQNRGENGVHYRCSTDLRSESIEDGGSKEEKRIVFDEKDVNSRKPNGGWGWMVVLGVALSNMSTQSLVSIFGLLFLQRLADLDIGTEGASLIMAVQTASLNLSGLITGPVIKKFSYRKTAAMGGGLVAAGLLFTTLADSLKGFIFTYGLFTGVGLGLLNPSTFVAIDSYFSSRKGRAVGLSLTGTGLGQMLLPFLIKYLLDEFDFRGTLLILSGISMHALLGATLYQPVEWHYKVISRRFSGHPNESKTYMTVEIDEEKDDGKSTRCGAANIKLLKNPSFVCLVLGLSLAYVGNVSFSMLLPFFLKSIDYSKGDIAACVSILAGADILGRLILPAFSDLLKIRSKTMLYWAAFILAFVRAAFVWQNSLSVMFAVAGICGFMRSAVVVNLNLSISEGVSAEKLPTALGLFMLIKGAAVMIFIYLVGVIRDQTKSYSLCIFVSSVLFNGFPFCFWLLDVFCLEKKICASPVER